jgi:hypothetical protein
VLMDIVIKKGPRKGGPSLGRKLNAILV